MNGAMKSAREMEGSVSVSAYAGHTEQPAREAPPLNAFLPPARPATEYAPRHERS